MQQLSMEDLTEQEHVQFEKAIAEGDTGAQEWEELMLMATLTSAGNDAAYKRRQALRKLYDAEIRRRTFDLPPGSA